MNKLAVLVALLACVGIVNAAVCAGTNTEGTAAACYCAQGYWGKTDATTPANTLCTQCTLNTNTVAPSATNTGAAVTVGACSLCVANYYASTAATATAAAVCTACAAGQTAPAGSTAATACVSFANVVIFSAFLSFLALFL